jgi:translation initiation factor 2 beta subunit (eIF-2beta)/eIF-5
MPGVYSEIILNIILISIFGTDWTPTINDIIILQVGTRTCDAVLIEKIDDANYKFEMAKPVCIDINEYIIVCKNYDSILRVVASAVMLPLVMQKCMVPPDSDCKIINSSVDTIDTEFKESFDSMVEKSYYTLDINHKPTTLILPDMQIEIKPTKFHWKNIMSYLEIIRRDEHHFFDFLKNELRGKTMNWLKPKQDGLIIHGKRIKQCDVADISFKYINLFVICPSCKKIETTFEKDPTCVKRWKFVCTDCGFNKYM